MYLRAFVALGVAALVALEPAAALVRACVVAAVDGPEARQWAAGAWSPLAPGQPVSAEAKLATGPGTRLKLACDGGIVVTVGVGTEVNLETLAGQGDSVVVQLIEGIIGLLAPPAGWRRFEVRTPLAIASVRGTEWLVEHGAEASAVFVRDGRVAVRARGGGGTLGPGEGITIAAGGGPGEVKVWGPPRIARATAALGFDWQ